MKQEEFPTEMQELMTVDGRRKVFLKAKSAKPLRLYFRAALGLVDYLSVVIDGLVAQLTKLQDADGEFVNKTLKLGEYAESNGSSESVIEGPGPVDSVHPTDSGATP